MDKFRLVLSPHARKDLNGLSDTALARIARGMKALEENPFPRGKLIRKIRGKKSDFFRLRADKYRVFYMLRAEKVIVLRVLSKKDANRYIQRLD